MATEAITETLQDVEKVIVSIARRFARTYGGELDLLVADALYYFIEAYEKYDGVTGTFEGWCDYYITKRLLMDRRRQLRRNRIVYINSLDALLEAECQGQESREGSVSQCLAVGERYFSLDEFRRELTEDAGLLVDSVFDTPRPVTKEVKRRGGWSPMNIRAALRRYVTENVGWTRRRAQSAFKEVSEALKP